MSSVTFLFDGGRPMIRIHLATCLAILLCSVTWAAAQAADTPKQEPAPNTEQLWKDLAGGDAQKAYRSMWALVGDPARTLPFLKAHLHPVAAPDPAKLARLIAELDDSHFNTREKASTSLEAYGELAEPALRQALHKNPTDEVRRRLEALLDRMDGPLQPGTILQAYRAIEVLEHVGNAEAQEILRTVAGGAPGARVTREAKSSLERLAHRPR